MNAKRVAIASALTLIVIGCFAAQIYQQKIFSYSYSRDRTRRLEIYSGITSLKAITIDKTVMLAFSPSFNVQADTYTASPTNSTRTQIYNYISANPGVQFRAVCASLCLPVGLAQYHLGVLVKSGLVSFVRDGRYKRFFISKRFTKREIAAICLLRRKTVKSIFEALLSKKELAHGKLADEVGVTSQALTWQMKCLRNTEFVVQTNDGLKTLYSINQASAPMLNRFLATLN